MARLFLVSLSLTIVIESAVLLFISRVFWRDLKLDNKRFYISAALPSLLTLPYLWFVFPLFLPDHMVIAVGEMAVVLAEALLLKFLLGISWQRSALASLLCNLSSYVVGVLLGG